MAITPYIHNKENFGKKLKNLIKSAGYSSREKFSDVCGVPLPTLNDYCKGLTDDPGITNITNIAQGLGISVEELLLGDEANCQKKKKPFTPLEEITPEGIFEAVNYLLSAYGHDIIEVSEGGYAEAGITFPVADLTITRDDVLAEYLEEVKKSYEVLLALAKINQLDLYDTYLEKCADTSNLIFNTGNRTLQRIADDDGSVLPL